MTAKMIKIGVGIAAVTLLSMVNVRAGGPFPIQWENAAEVTAAEGAPFYDSNGTTLLSAGLTNTTGDGFLVQLIALNTGTNYVLASATLGDNKEALHIDLVSTFINQYNGHVSLVSAVASNDLQFTLGNVLGIKFYNGLTALTAPMFGIVSNATITVPNPNWITPPTSPVLFEPDYTVAAYQGSRTAVFAANLSGFKVDTANPAFVVPEPSTCVLVGLGLFGAIGMIRRRRNG